jgi:hypothetical protein
MSLHAYAVCVAPAYNERIGGKFARCNDISQHAPWENAVLCESWVGVRIVAAAMV